MHIQSQTSLARPGSQPGMTASVRQQAGAEQGVRQILVISISMALCWLVAAVTAISGIKYLWDNRSFINTAK